MKSYTKSSVPQQVSYVVFTAERVFWVNTLIFFLLLIYKSLRTRLISSQVMFYGKSTASLQQKLI
jgi:hypothetical protein